MAFKNIRRVTCTLVHLIMLLSVSSAFAQTLEQFQVLIYTSPDRWHDSTVPNAMNEFKEMAKRHTFGLTWTQQPKNFTNDYLKKFDVIVFLHSRGYELSNEEMENFKKFIRNGGGFVGIHASSANRRQQEWFKKLVGLSFTDHPEEQTAVLHVVDKKFPATMHLPDKWIWTDEWYSYGKALTENINYLITIDEKTYDPDRTWGNDKRFTAMGDFHPIAWYQEYDGGRSFYTTLGHLPAVYKDQWFLAHIYGGIYWAATGLGISE